MSSHHKDASDVTWEPAQAITANEAFIYVDFHKRDWRYLWLRKRTVSQLIQHSDLRIERHVR